MYSTGRDGTLRLYLMRESEGRLECLNADKLQMDWPATTNLSTSFGLLVLGFRSVSVCNRFHVKLLKLNDSFVSSLMCCKASKYSLCSYRTKIPGCGTFQYNCDLCVKFILFNLVMWVPKFQFYREALYYVQSSQVLLCSEQEIVCLFG